MSKARGFTLFELLFTLALMSVMIGLTSFYFKGLAAPASNGALVVAGFIRKARAKALASTLAYSVAPLSLTQLKTTYAKTCSSTAQTTDNAFNLTLPSGAYMSTAAWSVCFSTRGIANSSVDITVHDSANTKTVQVVLGGAVRIQ